MRSVTLVLLLAACSAPARAPRPAPEAPFVLADEARRLVLPPGDETAPALARVRQAAEEGDPAAAWAYCHYLIDLFDHARFAADPDSRRLLLEGLAVGAGGAAEATDKVVDAILVAVDRIAARDRLHGGAQAARTVLELDRHPPRARAELFTRMAQLKAVARGGGPLAANAALRLWAFCDRAFQDAAAARSPERPGILEFCLYPLYDSDPEPYFDPDPARRPPEPAWRDLAQKLAELATTMAGQDSRLAPLGPALTARNAKLLAEKAALMPAGLDPGAVRAPLAPRAEPYEWTPLVHLGDGSKMAPAAELRARLTPILAQDGRGRVALAFAGEAPASALLAGAEVARSAGAGVVELAVGYEQTLKVPAGDYWAGKVGDGKVTRLGVVPVALELLGGGGAAGRGTPRAASWNPRRAARGRPLGGGEKCWRLVAPGGAFAPIAVSGAPDPAAALRAQLARVRSAFSDEDGLVLVPEAATVPYAALVQAAVAARWDGDGRLLFGALALATQAPAPKKGGDLVARVERRAGAKVTIAPDAVADKAAAVRVCYQEALDRAPRLAGTVVLELASAQGGGAAAVAVAAGPKDAALRKCAVDRVGEAMKAGSVQSARIELRP